VSDEFATAWGIEVKSPQPPAGGEDLEKTGQACNAKPGRLFGGHAQNISNCNLKLSDVLPFEL
jgi:hypothetical protein